MRRLATRAPEQVSASCPLALGRELAVGKTKQGKFIGMFQRDSSIFLSVRRARSNKTPTKLDEASRT